MVEGSAREFHHGLYCPGGSEEAGEGHCCHAGTIVQMCPSYDPSNSGTKAMHSIPSVSNNPPTIFIMEGNGQWQRTDLVLFILVVTEISKNICDKKKH